MEHIRIGSIELRNVSHFSGSGKYWEIVKNYPNPHYGQEKHFEQIGNTEYYRKISGEEWESRVSYHKSCFKHPESCYTIATIEENDDEEPDIKSVGSRPFNLNSRDFEDFLKICKSIYE